MITGTLPWTDEEQFQPQMAAGVFRYPRPDDPAVQLCLNCELPPDACDCDRRCPFNWQLRIERIAQGIARRELAQAMKEMER